MAELENIFTEEGTPESLNYLSEIVSKDALNNPNLLRQELRDRALEHLHINNAKPKCFVFDKNSKALWQNNSSDIKSSGVTLEYFLENLGIFPEKSSEVIKTLQGLTNGEKIENAIEFSNENKHYAYVAHKRTDGILQCTFEDISPIKEKHGSGVKHIKKLLEALEKENLFYKKYSFLEELKEIIILAEKNENDTEKSMQYINEAKKLINQYEEVLANTLAKMLEEKTEEGITNGMSGWTSTDPQRTRKKEKINWKSLEETIHSVVEGKAIITENIVKEMKYIRGFFAKAIPDFLIQTDEEIIVLNSQNKGTYSNTDAALQKYSPEYKDYKSALSILSDASRGETSGHVNIGIHSLDITAKPSLIDNSIQATISPRKMKNSFKDTTLIHDSKTAIGFVKTPLDYILSPQDINSEKSIILRGIQLIEAGLEEFQSIANNGKYTQEKKQEKPKIWFKDLDKLTSLQIDMDLSSIENIEVNTYPEKMSIALSQLIENASEHGAKKINISAKIIEENAHRYASIEISDDGDGFNEEHLRKAQKALFSTKEDASLSTIKTSGRKKGKSGNGIGLAGVGESVRELPGGQIFLESKAQEGSKFTLRFLAEAS
ncbi:ATP-binding protein [Candidatus Peregrinibacteria bacterium]|jgi:hypothetical protein|nr:ATP-binding protein [Candidatus Peregrinibacteria bacterium]